MSRTDSPASVSSVISKGGVSAREKIVSASALISISPVARLGFFLPPRSATTPRDADAELVAQLAGERVRLGVLMCGSNTTCVMPARSRRSMNTQPP